MKIDKIYKQHTFNTKLHPIKNIIITLTKFISIFSIGELDLAIADYSLALEIDSKTSQGLSIKDCNRFQSGDQLL